MCRATRRQRKPANNWLYPERSEGGAWREETWAMELFFKGPGGERAGALFAAVKDDADATRALDRIALLSLREAVLMQLLDKHPGLVFSINVTALTLAEERWFAQYTDEFVQALRQRRAADRVVFEIQEHPAELLKALSLDANALARRLELMRHAPLPMAAVSCIRTRVERLLSIIIAFSPSSSLSLISVPNPPAC